MDIRTTGLGLEKKINLQVNRAFMMKILFIKAFFFSFNNIFCFFNINLFILIGG